MIKGNWQNHGSLNSSKVNLKKCELLYLACEAAVTTLIDLFILGVDAETIETTLEVHTSF